MTNYFLATVYAQAFLAEHNIKLEDAIKSSKYEQVVQSYKELLDMGITPE